MKNGVTENKATIKHLLPAAAHTLPGHSVLLLLLLCCMWLFFEKALLPLTLLSLALSVFGFLLSAICFLLLQHMLLFIISSLLSLGSFFCAWTCRQPYNETPVGQFSFQFPYMREHFFWGEEQGRHYSSTPPTSALTILVAYTLLMPPPLPTTYHLPLAALVPFLPCQTPYHVRIHNMGSGWAAGDGDGRQ